MRIVPLLNFEELLFDMNHDRANYLIEALLAAHSAETQQDMELRAKICRLRSVLPQACALPGKPAPSDHPSC